jgi:hypothetical protein
MTYYTVYRTQNIVNGKYYFGVHKTQDPYDKYLGSGKILKSAIAKYGEDRFLKNVCFIFDNAEEAFAKEDELIQTYRVDPMCYNLRKGGSGGFDYINSKSNQTWRLTAVNKLNANRNAREAADLELKQMRYKQRMSNLTAPPASKEVLALLSKKAAMIWTGRKHRDSSKELMRQHKIGEKNSMFGRKWMFHLELGNRFCLRNEFNRLLNAGWQFGRKM